MTRANPASTPVATSKSAALARVLDSVPQGYRFYVAGECPAERAIALARKFHLRYGVGCSPAQRITRRKRGEANTILVMYWPGYGTSPDDTLATHESPDGRPALASEASDESPVCRPPSNTVKWLLLATDGTGPVWEQESLQPLDGKRRLIFCGYEFVRRASRGRTAWTWRRTKEEMGDWYALLGDQLARRHVPAAAHTLEMICRQPGFAGVREQSRELCKFARAKGYKGELPTLFFMQKISHGERMAL